MKTTNVNLIDVICKGLNNKSVAKSYQQLKEKKTLFQALLIQVW